MEYVDGYVCPLALQSFCFRSTLSISDWASWIQAIGSIAAILAALGVGMAQHRSALKVARKVEIDRRELMTVRALLAAEGYVTGLKHYWEDLSRYPAGPRRDARFVALGTAEVMVPMDLDSLAFLVLERAQDVLNDFSLVNARDQQWQIYRTGLTNAVFRTGTIERAELAARVRDLEQRTVEDLQQVPGIINRIRARILNLHPDWELPSIQLL